MPSTSRQSSSSSHHPRKEAAPPGFSDTKNSSAMRSTVLQTLTALTRSSTNVVTVHCVNGQIYTGVFFTLAIQHKPWSIGLKRVTFKKTPSCSSPHPSYVAGGVLLLPESEVEEIVGNVNFKTNSSAANTKSSDFSTDTEISKDTSSSSSFGRKLQAASSTWITDTNDIIGSLDDGNNIKDWDQFKVNETKFGVKNTFDENLYTTKLDKTKYSSSQVRHADKLAKEIEKQSSSNFHIKEERNQKIDNIDEEARYGAVIKSEYVPLPLKKKSSTLETKMSYSSVAAAATISSRAAPTSTKPTSTKPSNTKPDDDKKKSSLKLNPKAKEFKLSASAASFAPSSSSMQQQPMPPPGATAHHHNYNPYSQPMYQQQPVMQSSEMYGGGGGYDPSSYGDGAYGYTTTNINPYAAADTTASNYQMMGGGVAPAPYYYDNSQQSAPPPYQSNTTTTYGADNDEAAPPLPPPQ